MLSRQEIAGTGQQHKERGEVRALPEFHINNSTRREVYERGKRGLVVDNVVFVNLRDNPIMNKTLYTEQSANPIQWEFTQITHNHPENPYQNSRVKIGYIRNVVYEEEALKGELFIDESLCRTNGAMDLYNGIGEGKDYHVSMTCLVTEFNRENGTVGDEEYDMKALNLEPISIAVLESSEGACPLPYCGVNEQEEQPEERKEGLFSRFIKTIWRNIMSENKVKANCAENDALVNVLAEVGKALTAINGRLDNIEQSAPAKKNEAVPELEERIRAVIRQEKEAEVKACEEREELERQLLKKFTEQNVSSNQPAHTGAVNEADERLNIYRLYQNNKGNHIDAVTKKEVN